MNKEKRNAYMRAWNKLPKNKPKVALVQKLWRERNKKRVKQRERIKYTVNKDKILAVNRKWQIAHPEKTREYQRNYSKRKPHMIAAASMRRLNKKRQSTPPWAKESYIRIFYQLAAEATKELGVKYQVDHIVPLQSKLVCGLHCEFNLQVLSAVKNRAKNNKSWPDMPEQIQ